MMWLWTIDSLAVEVVMAATEGNNGTLEIGLRNRTVASRLILHPEPTLHGWIFTGSWNNYAEFFERQREDGTVKLDLVRTL